MINREKFGRIEHALKSVSDIDMVHEQTGIEKSTLRLILGQKLTKSTTKKYHMIRLSSGSYVKKWNQGKSFVELAWEEFFSPLQLAFLILNRIGVTRKKFREYLEKPDRISSWRIRHEMKEALAEDIAYSPKAVEEQERRGKEAEQKLGEWLTKKGISYTTEREAEKGLGKKTPDFLLKKPMKFMNTEINWVESKASFGEPSQVERDCRKQLSHYIHIFGPGLVVYWPGWVEISLPKDLKIAWKRDFEN